MIEKEFSTSMGCIHYWVSEHIRPDIRSLVFLPGLTADHRLFDKQIDYFEPHYNVLVWDAPGHAASFPFQLCFSIADKARWLDDILSKEGIASPVIIGQSMGGYVGQVYSQLFPAKLGAFVSIDSAPLQRHFMTSIEIWLLKHTEGMYRVYPWKALIRDGAKGCAETDYGRKLMEKMMLDYNRERYIKLVSYGYKILADAVEENLTYQIICPAVLICGEMDKAGSVKAYNIKWAKETQLPIHWIPNAGHNSNADAPEAINRIIHDFLLGLP